MPDNEGRSSFWWRHRMSRKPKLFQENAKKKFQLWCSATALYEKISPAYRKFLETLTATFAQPVFVKSAERGNFEIMSPRGSPLNSGTEFSTVHPVVSAKTCMIRTASKKQCGGPDKSCYGSEIRICGWLALRKDKRCASIWKSANKGLFRAIDYEKPWYPGALQVESKRCSNLGQVSNKQVMMIKRAEQRCAVGLCIMQQRKWIVLLGTSQNKQDEWSKHI